MKDLSIEEFLAEVAKLREKGWEPFIDEHGGIRVKHPLHTNDGSTMCPDVSPLQAVCLERRDFRTNAGYGGAVGAAVYMQLEPERAYDVIDAIHHRPRIYQLKKIKIRRKICQALGL